MSTCLRLFGLALLVSTASTTQSACGGDDGAPAIDAPAGPDAPPGCTVSDAVTMIDTNHVHAPHIIVVTSGDVQLAADHTYDIMGSSSHSHLVMVTAAQFEMLKAGGTIMVTSSITLDHSHVVTISC
jgi:hypothetical protein